MHHTATVLIALITLALAGMAETRPAWSAVQTLSAAAKKSQSHPSRRESGPIACTIVGCIHIPPGCHPEMGYTDDGTPTGFEIVVCPGKPPFYGNPR